MCVGKQRSRIGSWARRRRSCDQAHNISTEKINDAWREGKVLLVSLEVKGAYNGVDPGVLLRRLRERRIPEVLIRWVDSFCSSRRALIVVNNVVGKRVAHVSEFGPCKRVATSKHYSECDKLGFYISTVVASCVVFFIIYILYTESNIIRLVSKGVRMSCSEDLYLKLTEAKLQCIFGKRYEIKIELTWTLGLDFSCSK
jgi:hypothetical protein